LRRSLDVFLGNVRVGRLSEDGEGRASFRISEEYRRLPRRPVLSQSFEDDLSKVYRGRREELPAFFANLVPEGPLRELIETSLQIAPGDPMALLEAVGEDLPGAVELRPSAGEPEDAGWTHPDEVDATLTPLYDQVSTIAWPEVPPELSLKLAGLKSLKQVDERSFTHVAVTAGSDPAQTLAVLHDSLERIARAWRDSVAPGIMPVAHTVALRDYWASVPLLRRHFQPV
jgi:HipA-like protein